jgi:hypothetical protein
VLVLALDNAQGRWAFGLGGQDPVLAQNLENGALDPGHGVHIVNVPAEEKLWQHLLRPP